MNDLTNPMTASPPYSEDAYGWAQAQVELIRAGALERVDWANIAEEIEDMGQSQYDALESALRILLLHILKWEHQPLFRSRSWLLSIREQHRQFERRIERNSGLKSALEDIKAEAYRQARVAAQAETGLPIETFPHDPPGWNVINNPPMREEDLPAR